MASLHLDRQSLHSFYGDATSLITSILHNYISTVDETIASLQAAYANGNDDLRNVAHFHSPAFSYVGFPQLYLECKALEESCRLATNVLEVQQDFEKLVSRIRESRLLAQAELSLC